MSTDDHHKTWSEEISAGRIVERVRELIAEGNAKAVRLRTEDGRVFLEIPLTAGAVAGGVTVLAAPWLAILGALAALVTKIRLEVVPREGDSPGTRS
ncbi:MAG TPA: DUF4342 domain-containing protein [Bauldia sp.]|nr:DUF4342 domain-containing protein [Bauldia sp.]